MDSLLVESKKHAIYFFLIEFFMSKGLINSLCFISPTDLVYYIMSMISMTLGKP